MAPPVLPAELCHLSLEGWSCVLDPATLEITATARGLAQAVAEALPQPLRVTDLVRSDTGASFTYPDLKAAVRVEAVGRRLRVRVSSQREWELRWPVTGRTSPASRLIVTSGEGLALPTRDAFWLRMIGERFCGPAASGRWSMPFWGIERESSTFTYIVGADAFTEICLHGEEGVLSAGAVHRFRAREGFPDLDVTIVPSEGSVLGPAKEYRQWLVEQGGFVSFQAKMAKVPEAARLVGASHAYLWGDGRTEALLERLKSAGIVRMWLGYDQDPRGPGPLAVPAFVAKARAQGYLVGPYDTYDNIQDPKTSDSASSIWDADLFRTGCVETKEGSRQKGFGGRGCALSTEALRKAHKPYVADRVDRHLATGINSYFLDVDAFGELFEDWSPAHPLTRERDKQNRIERMAYLSGARSLVLGSEGGTSWSTPVVHFLHGAADVFNDVLFPLMEDKACFGKWWPDTGPSIFFKPIDVSTDFRKAKYSPRYRLPLFQAVFHDSVVATERWEMTLPKVPALARTRALFWQLYNVAPIWALDLQTFLKHEDLFVRHHRFFAEVHERAAELPVTDFAWLTADGLVQRTSFGDRVRVTANFGDEAYEGLPPLCVEARFSPEGRTIRYCP